MTEVWKPLELLAPAEPNAVIPARVGEKALVAVLHDGEWRAFADNCTHAECAFTEFGEIAPEDGVLICNCHGAEFALADGSVQLEPAEVPLKLFPVRVDAGSGELTVRLD
jgi:nitrite reductase/ring-hydroxylating ferredoxin subunit